MDYKTSIDLTYSGEIFQGFFTKKFLDDFGTATTSFMNWYKIYIHWNNIRRYYCIAWEKWFATFVYTSQKLIHLLR